MTEEQFQSALASKKPIVFPVDASETEKTLNAQWLLTALNTRLDIENGVILGDFRCLEGRVSHPWSFRRCVFEGAVDLCGCIFESAVSFMGCSFEKTARFDRARFHHGVFFNPESGDPTQFKDEFRFVASRVVGDCEFSGVIFQARAKFARMRTDDALRFSHKGKGHACFKQDVSFLQMRVHGELMFDDCEFDGGADFYNIEVEGPAFFRRAVFRKPAELKANALCSRSENKNDGSAGIDREPRIRFRHSKFHAEVNFTAAHFNLKADFTYLVCEEELSFQSADWNQHQLDLSNACVNGELKFQGSKHGIYKLQGMTVRCLVVDVCWINHAATTNSVVHSTKQEASINLSGFSYERIDGAAEMASPDQEHAKPDQIGDVKAEQSACIACAKKTEKSNVTAEVNNAQNEEQSDDARIRHIIDILVEKLKDGADTSTRKRLVSVLNRQGLEEAARKADRILRRGSRKRLSRFGQFIDVIYGTVFDYGINPWLVFAAPIVFWLVGIFAYSQQNAVIWKMDREGTRSVTLTCTTDSKTATALCTQENKPRETTIGRLEATGVSLHYALPGEIPLGSDYEAGDKRWFWILTFEGFATVQRVVGWISIPLIVAAFAGLIWRRAGEKDIELELGESV